MEQDWLAARTHASPDTTALIIEAQQWTYAELDAKVDALSGRLLAAGVAGGDYVASLQRNSLIGVCLIHGLARVGAVMVPLNTRLSALELVWQLDTIGCELLLVDEASADRAMELEGNGRVVQHIDESWLTAAPGSAQRRPVLPRFSLENLQAVVFTSGTTGHPKGAMLTFANHFWSATASAFRLGLHKDDRWLSGLPLYHVGGLSVIFRSCLYGTAIVLQDRFDLEETSRALDEKQVTLVSLVPTMLYRLLEMRQGKAWPASLRLVLLGGAAASKDLIARCVQEKVPVATTYGLTEAASQVATMLPEEVGRKPGSVGKPLMFTSVRIVDDQGRSMPPGTHGEVVVSGPAVMVGYFNDSEATAAALRQGELYTGDIGFLDEDGDLWMVQRRSDIIITGGENVYPVEVEAAIRQHPGVAAVCVVGVAHPEWGQQVAAMVVRQSGQTISEGELLQFCRQRLAGYKLPRLISIVESLPQTASGKVQRRAAAEQMSQET